MFQPLEFPLPEEPPAELLNPPPWLMFIPTFMPLLKPWLEELLEEPPEDCVSVVGPPMIWPYMPVAFRPAIAGLNWFIAACCIAPVWPTPNC